MRSDKIKKAQAKIESIEKEKRELVLSGASSTKVTAAVSKLKEANMELQSMIMSGK